MTIDWIPNNFTVEWIAHMLRNREAWASILGSNLGFCDGFFSLIYLDPEGKCCDITVNRLLHLPFTLFSLLNCLVAWNS
jgi:hypothetical protein